MFRHHLLSSLGIDVGFSVGIKIEVLCAFRGPSLYLAQESEHLARPLVTMSPFLASSGESKDSLSATGDSIPSWCGQQE